MQRGFKSYAEDLAVQVRKEMGLPAHGRLCAFKLAEFLGVPTLGFSKLAAGAKSLGVTARQLSWLTNAGTACKENGRPGERRPAIR